MYYDGKGVLNKHEDYLPDEIFNKGKETIKLQADNRLYAVYNETFKMLASGEWFLNWELAFASFIHYSKRAKGKYTYTIIIKETKCVQ